MTTKPAPVSVTDPLQQARDDHAQILELVEQMSRRHDRAALLEDVRALAAVLPAHFWTEEVPGGMLADALARVPNSERRVAALRDEHKEILRLLEDLRTELEAENDGVIQDRMADAEWLSIRIREHEESESKLLADLAYDESGSAD
jgi:hypothetical protein